MNLTTINKDEVHIWVVFPEEIKDKPLFEQYHNLMNEEERERHPRFYREKDRDIYLISRALVRTTLSRYLPISPWDWEFSKNKYGKPSVLPQQNDIKLNFNLSHTKGLIVLAVVLNREIGIDTENLTRTLSGMDEIAIHHFSEIEVNDLFAVDSEKKISRFFEYWTLKESYIKARGMGLSLPLDGFGFDFANEGRIDICFNHKISDDPKNWEFLLHAPSSNYRMAICVKSNSLKSHKFIIRKIIPFRDESIMEWNPIRQSYY